MLPATYQPNQNRGSGDENFFDWILPDMNMAAILNFGSKSF